MERRSCLLLSTVTRYRQGVLGAEDRSLPREGRRGRKNGQMFCALMPGQRVRDVGGGVCRGWRGWGGERRDPRLGGQDEGRGPQRG